MKYLDEKLVARLVQETQALAPQLAEWRRHLHQNPEVGFGTAVCWALSARRTQTAWWACAPIWTRCLWRN